MIFQDPMMALNPVYTVERQIGEVLRLHSRHRGARGSERVVELLRLVGVPAPERARPSSIRTISRAACASAS